MDDPFAMGECQGIGHTFHDAQRFVDRETPFLQQVLTTRLPGRRP
jgi:hypothetical protein